jgi:hypothetical protein
VILHFRKFRITSSAIHFSKGCAANSPLQFRLHLRTDSTPPYYPVFLLLQLFVPHLQKCARIACLCELVLQQQYILSGLS